MEKMRDSTFVEPEITDSQFVGLLEHISPAVPTELSHHGHNEGNTRAVYGGNMFNIGNFNIGSTSLRDSYPEKQYRVPHDVCSTFVGRKDELGTISTAFFHTQQVDGARKFVVLGMGGSGKTQLCLKFAETYRNRFWAVFFIDASTALAADNSFASIAQREGRKPCKQEGIDWLANISREWLLILDNADDAGVDVADYCPPSNFGHILITTRNKRCIHIANVGYLRIDRLQLEDGIKLLLKVAKLSQDNPKYCFQARRLVEDLEYLALALYHAGTTIFEAGYGLDKYLDIYDHMFRKNTERTGNPKYNPWELSRRAIEGMGTNQSAQACEILDVAGLFHFREIPFDLFIGPPSRYQKPTTVFGYLQDQWSGINTRKTSGESKHFLGNLREFPLTTSLRYDARSVRMALTLLNRYSLISFDENPEADPSSFSMHFLVHQWSRDRLSGRERQWSRCAAAAGLVYAIPTQERRDTNACNDRRRLLPHVNFFLFPNSLTGRSPESTFNEHLDKYQSRVAARLALVFVDNGQYEKAEHLYRASLAGLEKIMPTENLDTLAVVDSLGVVLQKQNRYVEAEKLNRRAVEGRARGLGDHNALTLESKNNLAVTLNSRGEHLEVEKLSREILKIIPPESPYFIDSLQNLALSLNHQAKYEQAAEMFTRVLAWKEENFGKEHLETIQSLDDLAAALSNEGSIGPAMVNYQEALTRRTSVLGKTHPHTLMNKSDIAWTMLQAGDLDNAKVFSREAYDLCVAHVGSAAKSYAPFIFGTCARVESAFKRYEEAEQLARKAVEGLEEDRFPPTHPDLLNCRSDLAHYLRKQRKYNEASTIYCQSLEGYQQQPGLPSRDEMVCLANLAVVLEKQKDFEKAESTHRKAFYGFSLLLSQNHPQTLACLENCARCLSERKLYDEAVWMYSRAIKWRKDKCGVADLTIPRNIAELAHILNLQGRLGIAWAMYEAACTGFDAARVRNRHAKKSATRFAQLKTTMNKENLPMRAPRLSAEEIEWVHNILAPIEQQETGSVVKELTTTRAGLKRAISISPIAEAGKRCTKRRNLTTDTSGFK